MKYLVGIPFWIIWVIAASQFVPQEETGQASNHSEFVFQIIDGKRLRLDAAYCLKSIMVRTYLTNDTFSGETVPSMRLDIAWESEEEMVSLSVETGSQNDPYCDSKDRFTYHRKPIKKNIHTFPDIVNYGSRYTPIKLDCSYIIVPELAYPCQPVKLLYKTPLCLSESVCSCRNVSLPGPNLKISREAKGVTIHWQIPLDDPLSVSDIRKIQVLVTSSQGFLPSGSDDNRPKKLSLNSWDYVNQGSGKFFFKMNAVDIRTYVVRGFFENVFQCTGNVTELNFHFPDAQENNGHLVIYISYVLLVLTFMIVIFFFRQEVGRLLCRKVLLRRSERQNHVNNRENIFTQPELQGLININNPLYTSDFQDDDLYLVDYQRLKFHKKLDEGNFGVVHLVTCLGEIKGFREFAVKQLKSTAMREDIEDFLEEMKTFKKIGVHKHVVRMVGYCKAPQPLSIVMEYVPYNLLKYLKNLREKFESERSTGLKRQMRGSNELLSESYITPKEAEIKSLNEEAKELDSALSNEELESFGLQIARGMEHLEKNGIVHRDLAARNVLLDKHKTLKISDFGMSRMGIYVNKTNRKFPLRWMSPEAITNRVFSNKSDVWSYGVLLWEIGTLGGFPYSELQNNEVIALLRKYGHLEQPDSVAKPLYDLMLQCWAYNPKDRPTFAEVVQKIELLRQSAYVDIVSLQDNYVFPPTEEDLSRR